MSNTNLSKYSAKIKDVYIELKGYEFFHSPFYKSEDSDKQEYDCSKRFIGREKILKRIESILKNTKIKSGAYLITGFRGMGKTSVIRQAIYNHNNPKISKSKLPTKNNYNFLKASLIISSLLFIILYFLYFSYSSENSCFTIYMLITSIVIPFEIIFFLKLKAESQKKAFKIYNSLIFSVIKIFMISFFFLFIGIQIYMYGLDLQTPIELFQNWNSKNELLEKFTEVSIFRIVISFIISFVILVIFLLVWDTIFYFLKNKSSNKNKNEKLHAKYEEFEINLSQDGLNEIDVLRRIAINIREYWWINKFNFKISAFDRKIYFFGKLILSKIQLGNDESAKPTYDSVLFKLNTLINRMSGQVTSHKEIRQNSNISAKANTIANITLPFSSYFNKDEVSYAVASAKEIEDYLIEIFKDIDFFRENNEECNVRQFAFIIDELDKVESLSTISIEEKESSNPAFDNSSINNNKFRKRQEAVATLLANLKGFLNVVRVKFFFIGGREMYDAYLADIADRDSFYSSIFNDVIYVESFFKDSLSSSEGKGGVTQMTEEYLCNIILSDLTKEVDKNESKDHFNMKKLFTYLELTYQKNDQEEREELIFNPILEKNDPQKNKFQSATKESRKKASKVISTLQNYIIYLTYRSNGTPKKITTLVEKIIISGSDVINDTQTKEDFFQNNLVVVHESSKDKELSDRLFLKFSFDLQYEIGLTSSLYRPYLISNSRHLKSLGDKLLFSSSFIIDHIFKFHSFGFSWRNLELIPEVVLINREPNLRKFIEDLMRFYSSNYIEDTISGIFDYKFRSVVRRELIYLSKTSDLSSAAFNFTLDESLSTKRHYISRLNELEERYKKYTPINNDNQFVHSISFVQTILGDLHFYDKEYDEAIIYYSESIQSLRFPTAISERQITRHQFLLWLRNQLKLGLTLEKIRAFDSAFSLYKTLIIDTERYLSQVVRKNKEAEKAKIDISEEHRTMHLIAMPFVAILAVTEKSRVDGITYASLRRNRKDFLRIIGLKNKKKKNKKNIIFDRYRRNFLKADYYNNVGSLLFYKNCQFPDFFDETKKGYILNAFDSDYKITGRKNKILEQQYKIYCKLYPRTYDFYPSLSPFNYYWNSLYYLTKTHQERIVKKINSHTKYTIPETVELKNNLLAISAGYLLPECIDMITSKRMYYLASVISKIGDSILSSLKKDAFSIPIKRLDILDISENAYDEYEIRFNNISKFRELLGDKLYTVETVLYTYKLAASLYKRAGHNSYYASHLIRILYTIKDLIGLNKKDKNFRNKIWLFLGVDINKEDTDKKYQNLEKVAEIVFQVTSWNNEIANRPQLLKYREILKIIDNKDIGRDILYNNLSNISNNREVLILVEEIKMKLYKDNAVVKTDYENSLKSFQLSKSLISPYGSVNSRYLRMLELKYRTERCHFIMKEVLRSKEFFNMRLYIKNTKYINKTGGAVIEKLEVLLDKENTIGTVIEFLIKEAFFCLRELIKMFKIYDPGYVIGYSFIAIAYERMGDWCNVYANYKHLHKNYNRILSLTPDEKKQIEDETNSGDKLLKISELKGESTKIDGEIKKILGSETLANIDARNYYESAIQYYYKVIQMHSDSKAYSDKAHEMYMLEDDYNDISAHYVIAAERVRVNTGSIKERIQKIKESLEKNKSKLYTYKSYLPEEDDTSEIEYIKKNIGHIYEYLKFLSEKVNSN